MGVAEIYFDIELFFQFLVADKQNVVVPCYRFHLGESLFHPLDAVLECADGNGMYFLKEGVSELPVGVYEQESFSVFPRRDKVAFHVADSLFVVDNLGSFLDTALVLDSGTNRFLASPLPRELFSMRFDFPAIRACDICSDSHSGHRRKVKVVLSYAFGSKFRGLVVEQIRFHGFSKLWVKRNSVRTDTGVFPSHIRVVIGVCRIVFPPLSRAFRNFV